MQLDTTTGKGDQPNVFCLLKCCLLKMIFTDSIMVVSPSNPLLLKIQAWNMQSMKSKL